MILIKLELSITAYVAHRCKKLEAPKRLIEEIDTAPETAPSCPNGKFKMHVRIRDSRVQQNISLNSGVLVGTSPAMKTEGTTHTLVKSTKQLQQSPQTSNALPMPPLVTQSPNKNLRKRTETRLISTPQQMAAQLVQTSTGRTIILTPSTTVVTPSGQRLTVVKSVTTPQQRNGTPLNKPVMKVSPHVMNTTGSTTSQQQLAVALAQQLKNHSYASTNKSKNNLSGIASSTSVNDATAVVSTEFLLAEREQLRKEQRLHKLQSVTKTNHGKCDATPIYGSDLRDLLLDLCENCSNLMDANQNNAKSWFTKSYLNCHHAMRRRDAWSLTNAIKSYTQRTNDLKSIFSNFVLFVPPVSAPRPYLHISHPHPSKLNDDNYRHELICKEMSPKLSLLHPIISAMNTQVSFYLIFFIQ